MKNNYTKETKEALRKAARRGGLHSAPKNHPWKRSYKPDNNSEKVKQETNQ